MEKTAVMSDCGKFRYLLTRHWGGGYKKLLFVMQNPSTADHDIDDPTIRRCISFAKDAGYDGFEVVNLVAYRATDPKELKRRMPIIPPDPTNDQHIVDAIKRCSHVCVAWGACSGNWNLMIRAQDVWSRLICPMDKRVYCLGLTTKGYMPRHPLMVRKDQPLDLFISPMFFGS